MINDIVHNVPRSICAFSSGLFRCQQDSHVFSTLTIIKLLLQIQEINHVDPLGII